MKDSDKTIVVQEITPTKYSNVENVTQIGVQHMYTDFTYKVPIQVPSLFGEFVVSTKLKKEIIDRLLSDNKRGILAITAIQGLGGIGKTTLAIVLTHDEEVQKHFSDGILWATLGQEPDKLSLLNSWIQALGDYRSNHTTVETASIHLRTLLYEKRVLLVIDDAWDSSDVKPFLVGGPNCQTIITTRKAYIADDLGAKAYPLNVMTEEQSLELFKNILKESWDEIEREEALKVAKDVGYLPLALNLAAKRRKRDYFWEKLHEALEEEIARLSVLESPRSLKRGEEGLEASLNLSLKALRSFDVEAYEDFVWLGILPEDVKINERMVSTLWGIDDKEGGEILEVLWDEGLLIQDLEIQFGSEKLKTYRIHDLFHDIALYFLTRSPVAEKDTDLPGMGLTLKEAHASLLNRYQSQTQKGLWHTLEDDVYIHSHLTWHLEKAGNIEDIHKLISEENKIGRNGWYEALESLGQNVVFIEDVTRAWNLSKKESEYLIKQGKKASSVGMEIRYALINSSINSLSANIPAELLVALLETKTWTETKVFMYAQKEPDPYKRATKLILIYQKLMEESTKMDALEKAIVAASIIQDVELRAKKLSSIVPILSGQKKEEVLEKALDAASLIKDEGLRAEILSSIVPILSGQKKEEVLEKALNDASKIQNKYSRAMILLAIYPNLNGQKREEVIEETIDIALKIKNVELRTKALSFIYPELDGQKKEEIINEIIDTASGIRDEYWRTLALSAIFPNLSGQKRDKVVEKAIDAATTIKNEELREKALSSIFPNLDGTKKVEVVKNAIDTASEIKDEYLRTKALLAIFPNLDGQKREEIIEEAIDTASKIKNDELRAKVLDYIFSKIDGQKKDDIEEEPIGTNLEDKDSYNSVEKQTNLPIDSLYNYWERTIQTLAGCTRSDLLVDITSSISVIYYLGGDEALTETSQAIIDVSRWWP